MPQFLSFIIRFFLTILIFSTGLIAQPEERYNSAQILQDLKKLNILGSVLYIAAHPDDENTRLITYFTKGKLYNTGYLSLTRGDGGQNLIGPELYEQLGLIRTQELLQARKIDGGKQFFSRANDFGYSKNPDETFRIWDKEKVLSDMVWVIRKFRPDVMITRFNTEPGKTHGHHTASATLAVEAFDAAADPNRFPEQLKYVRVWQAKRLLWNTNWWFYGSEKDFKTEGLLKIDVGGYNSTLGESYTEIAAKSRSMHKSQGFGSSGTRGLAPEYLDHIKGAKASKDIFEDIDVSWSRVPDAEKIGPLLQKAFQNFNPQDPSASLDVLLQARDAITMLPDSYWKKVKLDELEHVIKACLGLWTEAVAADYSAVPGQSIKVNVEVINRSTAPLELQKISYLPSIYDTILSLPLKENVSNTHSTKITIPEKFPYSQPYWLIDKSTTGMFTVTNQVLIGLPENPPAIEVEFTISIKGKNIIYKTPLVYKKTDPVKGEQYRPFEITPALFINCPEKVLMFADDKSKSIEVTVKAGKSTIAGKLMVAVPSGWKCEPSSNQFSLINKGAEQIFSFKIFPSSEISEEQLKIFAICGKDTFNQGLVSIKYDHIPAQSLFPPSTIKAVRLDLKKKGDHVGYIMGAGDDVPASLRQVGYKVTILKEENINLEKLQQFNSVVIGIRAFNMNERLRYCHPALLEYMRLGGTMVVQYNTLPGRAADSKLVTDSIGPYPFKLSNERVTMEDAPIKILNPKHILLNKPNKITDADFANWIQERGLYFPNEWSKKYETIISCNDIGETPKEGGILYARYGKGVFIYTSYSWFRELPAGVPGAYRLFVNLISAGQ
jgi:LmbE family N-acetylglucosaminyl deacetylase